MLRRRHHEQLPATPVHPERKFINYQSLNDTGMTVNQRQLLGAKTEITVHRLYDEVSDYFVWCGFAARFDGLEPVTRNKRVERQLNRIIFRNVSRSTTLVLLDGLATFDSQEPEPPVLDCARWVGKVLTDPSYDPEFLTWVSGLKTDELEPALTETAAAIITSRTLDSQTDLVYLGQPCQIWTS